MDRGRAEDAATALARAVGLRRGPLLEADPAPWAAAARERLDARFLRLLLGAAELLRDDASARPHLERAAELLPQDPRISHLIRRGLALAPR